MRRSVLLASPLVLTAVLSPLPSLAQGVVATELWAAWQQAVAGAGGTLSAEESREGNKLVLNDLRLDTGDVGGVVQVQKVTLISQADGSVGVILPDTFPLLIELPATAPSALSAQDQTAPSTDPVAREPEVTKKVVLEVEAPALKLIVRGIGQRADFEAAAPKLTVRLDRFIPPLPKEQGEVLLTLALDHLNLRYSQDYAVDVPVIDGALSFDAIEAALAISASQDGDSLVSLMLGKSETAFSGAFPSSVEKLSPGYVGPEGSPDEAGLATILQVLADGLRASGSTSLGPMTLHADFAPGASHDVQELSLATEAATANFTLDASAIGYQSTLSALDLTFTDTDFALSEGPAEFSLAEFRSGAKIGLNGLRGPQDWGLAYVMRGLDLSPHMWDVLDPRGDIAREPMTLALDFAGRYALLPEALTPGWAPSAGQLPLAELSVGIKELDLALLGLGLTGSGALSFDPSDLHSFDGFPAPAGQVSFVTTGAYALIDTLTSMGKISADELSGLRAALLMLGRMGDAPDTLLTDVEFREKSLFLNGMKIR